MELSKTCPLPLGKAAAAGLPFSYIVGETCVSMVINTAASTLPVFLSSAASSPKSPDTFAAGLTPQIIIGATMSVLAPALLTRRRQNRGGIRWARFTARPTLRQIVVTALLSTLIFSVAVLAFIERALPAILVGYLDRPLQTEVSAIQGILAAALLTPLALHFLFRGTDK